MIDIIRGKLNKTITSFDEMHFFEETDLEISLSQIIYNFAVARQVESLINRDGRGNKIKLLSNNLASLLFENGFGERTRVIGFIEDIQPEIIAFDEKTVIRAISLLKEASERDYYAGVIGEILAKKPKWVKISDVSKMFLLNDGFEPADYKKLCSLQDQCKRHYEGEHIWLRNHKQHKKAVKALGDFLELAESYYQKRLRLHQQTIHQLMWP